jgi:hypothetical protein
LVWEIAGVEKTNKKLIASMPHAEVRVLNIIGQICANTTIIEYTIRFYSRQYTTE